MITFIHTSIVQFILYQVIQKVSLNKEFITYSKKSCTFNTNLLINLKQSTLIEIKILS